MTNQALVQRHLGIAIDVAVLTTTVNRTGDTLLREVVLDDSLAGHVNGFGIADVHLRLLGICQVCHLIAVTGLTTRATIDITTVQLSSTDMTARHVDGSLTRVRSKLERIRPAESEAVFYRLMLSLARNRTYRRHSTTAIDGASDVAAIDVDEGVTTYHTRLRVVVLFTIITRIGIRTTTGTIDVTTVELSLGSNCFVRTEIIIRIIRICNTDSTAIDIHRSTLVVVTVLTTTIDRTLDKRC